jgi:Fe-S cluster assembly iron-binding protein IscA
VLALTDAAAAAINALVESSELGRGGLRISAGTAGTDEIELGLADGPAEGDHIVSVLGASVYVDPAVEEAIADFVLDAVLDEDGVHFGLVDHGDAGEHEHGHVDGVEHGHDH